MRKSIYGFISRLDSKGYRCHPDFSTELEIPLPSLRHALFCLDRANFFRDDTTLNEVVMGLLEGVFSGFSLSFDLEEKVMRGGFLDLPEGPILHLKDDEANFIGIQ